jgi:8-oxo-dGTP pyrophosphatase MutT (NUDIX family)
MEGNMERQFVATVYIIENGKVLLIKHRKLNKWLPPGGHLDPNETPPEGAKREALEETGIEIEFIKQENVWISQSNACSFERPYLCLLEEIPEHKSVPQHQHIDFIYLAQPVGGKLQQNHNETDGLRWFSLEEVEDLEPEVEIFTETQRVIRQIIQTQFGVRRSDVYASV